MKNLKKVLALVLALCMILSTFTALTITTASAATPTFNDIEGKDYAEAVEVLSALGIVAGYEDGSFGGDKVVTRAEMAAFIVREIGLSNAASSASANSSSFTDVGNGSADWAVGSINIATQKKIIVGRGDGTFDPNSTVNYQEAVKMLVCALGRDVVATRNGGWPSGYLIAGASCGLTDGITGVEATDGCNRGVVAVLLYNALEIDLMEETSYSGSAVQVEETYKTLLYDYLNVVKYYDAEITATPTQGASKSADGFAKISGTYDYYNQEGIKANSLKVEIGETDPDAFFGDAVIVYTKDNGTNKTPTMLCIVADHSTQDAVTIDVADFYSSNPVLEPGDTNTEGTNNSQYIKLYYKTENDTKAQSVKLLNSALYSDNCTIVKNGVVESPADFKQELSKLENGTIKLIDAKTYDVSEGKNYNGADGVYEKVIVEAYNDFVVSDVDTEEKVISFNNKEADSLDLDDENKTYTIVDTKGNEVKLEDIKENDVLSIYADEFAAKDVDKAEVLKIVVCSNSIEGTVTEKTSKAVYIDGEKYDIAGGVISLDDFELDDTGTFYLNAAGDIAYLDTEAASKDYAVVYEAYQDGAKKIVLNVITSKGEDLELTAQSSFDYATYAVNATTKKYSKVTTEYDFADLVERDADGNVKPTTLPTGKKDEDYKTDMGWALEKLSTSKNGVYTPYVVSYDLKKGTTAQIDTIYTAGTPTYTYKDKDNKDQTAYAETYATRFAKWSLNKKAYYNNSEATLGAYTVDGSTVIFDIPVTVNKVSDSSKIKVYGKSGLTNSKTYDDVSVYDLDKDNVAKAVLIKSSANTVDEKDPIAVIQTITRAKNADGDDVYKFYMMQNGKIISKITEDTNTLDTLGKRPDGTYVKAGETYKKEPGTYTQYSLDIGYGLYTGAAIMFSEAGDGSIDNLLKIYPIASKTAGDAADEEALAEPYFKTEYFTLWNFSAKQGGYNEGCDCFIAYGKITKKDPSAQSITVATRIFNDKDVWEDSSISAKYGSANITVVDYTFEEDDEKVVKGSASDLKEGRYVLVRKNGGSTKDIVVYKNFAPYKNIDIPYAH